MAGYAFDLSIRRPPAIHPILAGLLAVAVSATPLRAQCPDGTPPPCAGARAPLPRVQVLGFTAPDSADLYLASGIAEDVRAALLGTHDIVLVGPRARSSAAEYALSGSIQRTRDGLSVTARIERVSSGIVLWTSRLNRPLRDLAAVAPEIASQTLHVVGVRATPTLRATTADPVAYDLHVRARYLIGRFNAPALARAVMLYREVIARDSTSPLGWAGLARALGSANRWHFRVAGVPPDSLLAIEFAAAERAVELAPTNLEVLLMRGQVAWDVDPTSRTASLRVFREVVARDSLNGEAWRMLGTSLLEIGDGPGATSALGRAVALEPEDGRCLAQMAIGWLQLHRPASALVWAERAVAADPTLLVARGIAGQAAFWTGRIDQAQAHFEAADRLDVSRDRIGQMELTRVLLVRGDTTGARAYVSAAAGVADTANPAVHVASAMADAYLALGDTARAFWWLARYHPQRDVHFQMHLRGEQAFDGIRDDPRFRALLSPQP